VLTYEGIDEVTFFSPNQQNVVSSQQAGGHSVTQSRRDRSKTSAHNDTSQTKLREVDVEKELDTSISQSAKPELIEATISAAQLNGESLDISALETWLWEAACTIRGATDAPKFKDFILPLIFYKRLSDVFDDEFAQHIANFGSEDTAREIIEADHQDGLKTGHSSIVRFYVPSECRWDALKNHSVNGLGEFVTDCMRRVAQLNPDLRGVLDIRDFNERQGGQRILDDDRLADLIQVVSRHRLGLQDTEPDVLGRAYEYLLRKFAEGQGQSAGEFYTPKEVGWLIAHLINPEPHTTIYDPACGSAGLLIKSRLLYKAEHPDEKSAAPKLFGQELNPTTFAMAKMNMFLHDFSDSSFSIGDTFTKPGFTQGNELKRFDYVVANPMWNQGNYDDSFYDNDNLNRFLYGIPPKSSADWGWVQHMLASLKENGRAAVVLDTGAVSRGAGSESSSREGNIRKAAIQDDLIECVILLPENLFYNTSAAGIIVLLNRSKPEERREQILLINASNCFAKEKPKNVLTDQGIKNITEAYRKWQNRERFSSVITLKNAEAADYSLSPSRFVDIKEKTKYRPLNEILEELHKASIERETADKELTRLLQKLGLKTS
jgi:type I restriction enzyme M protein